MKTIQPEIFLLQQILKQRKRDIEEQIFYQEENNFYHLKEKEYEIN